MMRTGSFKILRCLSALILGLSLVISSGYTVYAEGDTDAPIRVSLLHKYDSADLAILMGVDSASHTMRFRNHDTGRNYTLSYDDTTWIYDLYGRPLAVNRLTEGEAVDITFLKNSRHLNSVTVSDKVWRSYDITDFNLVCGNELARINGAPFHLDNKTVILSGGRSVYPEDILDTDTLFICGIDKELYGVTVTKGHGYVSLSADQVDEKSLVGAWIELDRQIIRRITPHMLISAPEGSYSLGISGKGARYNSEIEVKRGRETVIDTSVVKIEKPKEGLVTFRVTPAWAGIKVDGEFVSSGTPHSLTYGRHDLTVEAEGYVTQSLYLNVAEADALVEITLEKTPDADEASSDSSGSSSSGDSASSGESSSDSASSENSAENSGSSEKSSVEKSTKKSDSPYGGNSKISDAANAGSPSYNAEASKIDTSSGVTIAGYYVTFEAPKGVEAYLDGNYLGVTPISFTKVSGVHTVSLKKKGYKNRSFTINIDSERNNAVYSFPDLILKENKTAEEDDSDIYIGDEESPSTSYDTDSDISDESPAQNSDDEGNGKKDNDTDTGNIGDFDNNSAGYDYDPDGTPYEEPEEDEGEEIFEESPFDYDAKGQ